MERTRFCDKAVIDLPQRMDRRGRQAHLSLRLGTVVLKRPARPGVKDLPEGVKVSFVEVVELHPPKGAEPVHWLLLTTHPIADAADAWRIVSWYKQRWIIEQLFRSLKNQGLRIEDSQLEGAEALIKLVTIATKVACIVIQLVQARNGGEQLSIKCAFTPEEIEALAAINKTMKGRTELQKNPHGPLTLSVGGMDHCQARRMDRLRFASTTRTDHVPQRNGSLPNHRRCQSHRKCVETLVRKQGPITTGFGR